jgi:hypothetical protein
MEDENENSLESISSTFYARVFFMKVTFWQLFYLHFGFGTKILYEKKRAKMLMKLTFIDIFCPHLALILWCQKLQNRVLGMKFFGAKI